MAPDIGWGVAGVLTGGFLNGSFVLPMKRMHAWRWENSWLVYSVTGLIITPWIMAPAAVPRLGEIFMLASAAVILKVLLFGFGWGVGSVLFGLGVNRMGLAVGYGLILGLIAPIGTFLPLLVLHPERLWTRQGQALMIGTLIVIAGIVLCAKAGRLREQASPPAASQALKSSFAAGLLICILSGIFSPMLNFAFVFGEELQRKALEFGAAPALASNAIWSLALTAGFVANAGWCVILLFKNRTWNLFARSNTPAGHWAGGTVMGVVCFGSFMVYGTGATLLGPLGGIVGWPLFMSMSLITSNVLGAVSGEWTGAPRKAYLYSLAGIGLLIVAITIISSQNR